MALKKVKTVFVCQECGNESPKWIGQCICGAWNSMVEEKEVSAVSAGDVRSRNSVGASKGGVRAKASKITEVKSGAFGRLDTGIGELNRVLGGGIVQGSLVLISGEPGIGKSTIIIQAASKIAEKYGAVLYVSGEESEEQIKIRGDRVCMGASEQLYLLSETNMDNIGAAIEELKPKFLIIDSIQTMYTEQLDSAAGSVSQVRACGHELMKIAKVQDIPVFIVAHVTKSGELAGPKIVEHLVDCVLHFSGERSQELRILRAFKNRFGTTSEIGAFEMRGEGLIEIENLSKTFLEGMEEGSEGSVATAVYEGTRPLLLEIQALTAPTGIGFARRTAIGIDSNRLSMLIAVLERKAGLNLINQDVYVNVVGGIKPEGTSTDLAVALAIYSSLKGKSLGGDTLAIGEIGLTGDLRSVRNCEKIFREASRLGFKRIVLPEKNLKGLAEFIAGNKGKIEVLGVKNIKEAINSI